jgi:hypothetical protein
LHYHCRSSATTITDCSNTVLAWLELMKQSHQYARARAAEGMAKGYRAPKRVDDRIFKAEDLRRSVDASVRWS